jgi:hypothetical protein
MTLMHAMLLAIVPTAVVLAVLLDVLGLAMWLHSRWR